VPNYHAVSQKCSNFFEEPYPLFDPSRDNIFITSATVTLIDAIGVGIVKVTQEVDTTEGSVTNWVEAGVVLTVVYLSLDVLR
jgi:hypothetical protein